MTLDDRYRRVVTTLRVLGQRGDADAVEDYWLHRIKGGRGTSQYVASVWEVRLGLKTNDT